MLDQVLPIYTTSTVNKSVVSHKLTLTTDLTTDSTLTIRTFGTFGYFRKIYERSLTL